MGSAPADPPERATQTIPPKTRRFVLRRDHRRCQVPGCQHATWVDIHHLDPRAEGGGHDPDRLVTLCGAHHRALHDGTLVVEGSAPKGLTFRHADGSTYGSPAAPGLADALAKVFKALVNMGFRESEAKGAVTRLQKQRHTPSARAEELLRVALLDLVPAP
jgi:hypothetical protein